MSLKKPATVSVPMSVSVCVLKSILVNDCSTFSIKGRGSQCNDDYGIQTE